MFLEEKGLKESSLIPIRFINYSEFCLQNRILLCNFAN